MPHIVELELALEGGSQPPFVPAAGRAVGAAAAQEPWQLQRADFRVHGGGTRHWLLAHPFGQELLITKLQQERPDMTVPRYRHAPEMLPLLDSMIDLLGMRSWTQPTGARGRVRVWYFLLKCQVMLASGRDIPDWRTLAD